MLAPMYLQADSIHNCLVSKGYKYGKVRPDQVYIPPPPPRSDWVKPGVSEDESSNVLFECGKSVNFDMDARRQCMLDKGFKWEVVDPHPSR